MRDFPAYFRSVEPHRFWTWTSAMLTAAFGSFLLLILLSAWISVTTQLIVAAVLVGGLLLSIVVRDEIALLCAVLAGFVFVVRYKEGFQVEEVLYGLSYLSYLGYWFVSRLFIYRDKILRSGLDWALFLFLIYTTISLVLTPLLDGNMKTALSEWLSLSMISFYFPIREACIRQRHRLPQKPILYSFGFLALFIALRNFNDYRIGLSQAEYLFQIATGRVVMNEHVLLMAGLVSLVFLLYARRWPARSLLAGLFLIYTSGIIIGQSRAVWVSFALGVLIIFLFVDAGKKLRIALLALGGLTTIIVIGALLFDNFISLILAGLTNRMLSLRSAVTEDVSLINRFVEMEAAWSYIKENPVVGYGFGVPIRYYSLVYDATRVSSFVHNAYVGVWYRHGLIGLLLISFFYFGSIWTFLRVARNQAAASFDRLIAMAAVACLAAEALLANSANPFATSDTALIIAAMAGLGSASRHYVDQTHPIRGEE